MSLTALVSFFVTSSDGSGGTSSSRSSISSSVELQAEKALRIGGRTGGISMMLGASTRFAKLTGDNGGVLVCAERSGQDRGYTIGW